MGVHLRTLSPTPHWFVNLRRMRVLCSSGDTPWGPLPISRQKCCTVPRRPLGPNDRHSRQARQLLSLKPTRAQAGINLCTVRAY